jgi:hypothetical protein
MRTTFRLPLFLLTASLVLAGCGRNQSAATSPGAGGTGSSEAMERAEVASALAESPEAVEDGAFESSDEWTTAESAASGGNQTLEAIRPLRWWRTIRNVERTFEFAFADTDSTGRPTRAIVTVHKKLTGGFHILAGPAGQDSAPRDSLSLIRKPLVDHWVRRILLRRVRTEDDARVRWRIAATSGVEVTSRSAQTNILSLRVQTASQDTTIENPLAFWFLRRIVKVTPGEDVTLTVTTAASDDVVVLISRAGRFRFHNNGDNTYTGHWRAPALGGLRHVGVNALSRGTLFDDAAPYDSKAWILPYVVRGEVMAEYLPQRP